MNERNLTLDWFKILLSILVVCIHSPTLFGKDSVGNWYFGSQGFTTIAVPLFFIINGYFFYPLLGKVGQVRKYIFKVLMLYIVWSIIYLPLYWGEFSLRVSILFFVTGYFHLWYIAALLFASVLYYVLSLKIKSPCYIFFLSVAVYLFFRSVDPIERWVVVHQHLRFLLSNLPTGFFFLSVGCMLRYKGGWQRIGIKTAVWASVASFVLFLILLYPSFNFWARPFVVKGLMLPIVCTLLFATVMRLSVYRESRGYVKYLSSISAGIYFIHIYFVLKLYPFYGDYYNIVHLLPMVAMCVAVSVVLIAINKRVKYLL